MTTTDTDALTERIGRILNDEGWTFEGIHEPGEYDDCEECRLAVDPIAARIARVIAAEVQAAKAEALDEFMRFAERHKDDALTRNASDDQVYRWATVFTTAWNYRATEYETGDRA